MNHGTDRVEQVVLERIKFRANRTVSRDILDNTRVRAIADYLADAFLVSMQTEVLARKLPDKRYTKSSGVTFESPASTWQMFKHTHAGSWWLGWLVRRRNVRYTESYRSCRVTVDISDYLAYPWQEQVTPGLGPAVRIPVFRDSIKWEKPRVDVDPNPVQDQ